MGMRQYMQAQPAAARELAQITDSEDLKVRLLKAANAVQDCNLEGAYEYVQLTPQLALRVSKEVQP